MKELLGTVDITRAKAVGARLLKQQQTEVADEISRGVKLFRFEGVGNCLGLVTKKAHLRSHVKTTQIGHALALRAQSQGHVAIGLVARLKFDGFYEVSLRSIGDVDVSKICERYGGGGHAKAAGMKVEEHVFKGWTLRKRKPRKGKHNKFS